MKKFNSEYYVIKKKELAIAINFICGERYMVWNDNEDPNKKIYSFRITDNFMKALTELNALKRQFYKK